MSNTIRDEEIIPRMKAALKRLKAIVGEGKDVTVSHTMESRGSSNLIFGAYDDGCTIMHHGPTPEAAVDGFEEKFGTPESRKAKALEKLKADAEALGLTINE